MAGIVLNVLVVGGITLASQILAVRRSADRLMAALHRELSSYRMILLLPPEMGRAPVHAPDARKRSSAARKAAPEPKPLATPDPRLLQRLDPTLALFIRDNPRIESIVTREIVRDLDSKVLNIPRLMRRSTLAIRMGIAESGRISGCRIVKSSRVPSIDHLALELARLLEAYQLTAALKDFREILASISIEDRIEINLTGELRDSAAGEEARRKVQGLLALLRFSLKKEDSAFLLQDVSLAASGGQIIVSKAFDKEPLVLFLQRYYKAAEEK